MMNIAQTVITAGLLKPDKGFRWRDQARQPDGDQDEERHQVHTEPFGDEEDERSKQDQEDERDL